MVGSPNAVATGSVPNSMVITSLNNTVNGPLQFGTVSTIRATIATDGNVGIGTNSPTFNLHVSGADKAMRIQSSNDEADISFIGSQNREWVIGTYDDSDLGNIFHIFNPNTGTFPLKIQNSTGRMEINKNNAGIDTYLNSGDYVSTYGAVVMGQAYANPVFYNNAKVQMFGFDQFVLNVENALGNVQYAGRFEGKLHVQGTLSKSSGSFKIDHPLDPANKFLYHSFVESPDMMNIYNGNVVLDGSGEARVNLPDYFEALNMEFRYQLTAIGASCPGLYISDEVDGNSFKIAGGSPGAKVSWQVTGIRQDAFAKEYPIEVVVEKNEDERGKYLHPEVFGMDRSMRITPGKNMAAE